MRTDVSPLVIAPCAGIRDRAQACWFGRSLDAQLAAGMSPERNAALALRARRLTALIHRRTLAQWLRTTLAAAGVSAIDSACEPHSRGRRTSRWQVSPYRERVAAAGEELSRLAEDLERPGPVCARGVAEAVLLLGDGTGALYNRAEPDSVRELAAEAREHLKIPC